MRSTCTRDHAALKLSGAEWLALEYVKQVHLEADADGPAELLEARNCSCGSTLLRTIERDGQATIPR